MTAGSTCLAIALSLSLLGFASAQEDASPVRHGTAEDVGTTEPEHTETEGTETEGIETERTVADEDDVEPSTTPRAPDARADAAAGGVPPSAGNITDSESSSAESSTSDVALPVTSDTEPPDTLESGREDARAATSAVSLGTTVPQYTLRGLAMDAGTRRIDLAPPDRAFRYLADGSAPAQGISVSQSDEFDGTLVDLRIGMGFAVADNLELGGLLFPFSFAPSDRPNSGNIQFYGRYRFLRRRVEMAAQVGIRIPIIENTDVRIDLAIPIKVQLLDTMHISTGIGVPLVLADDDTIVGLSIPLEYAVNVTPSLFAGVSTGFFTELHPNEASPAIVNLGFFVGYTFHFSDRTALDLQGGFQWPDLVGFGDNRDETTNVSAYQVTFGASIYFGGATEP
ncbi:MAG: hypothetical protein AAGE52_10530 [Myxococcota bacterium]